MREIHAKNASPYVPLHEVAQGCSTLNLAIRVTLGRRTSRLPRRPNCNSVLYYALRVA